MENRINLFNIKIDNLKLLDVILKIENNINKKKKSFVVTPNVDHIIKLQKDKEFLEVYNKADLVLTDGVPLIWASKVLGTPIKEKISGSDLLPVICELSSKKGFSIYLLGGKPGVAEQAKSVLEEKYQNINIKGTYSPPFTFENDFNENDKIIKKINKEKPDILFVGLGAPKQEKWIYNNLRELDVNVALGIGASFDFIAGTIKRAPKWMQKIGLEWLYRLLKEPKRMFKRYLIDDMAFFPLIIKYKLKENIKVPKRPSR